jgi:hypothetical protein
MQHSTFLKIRLWMAGLAIFSSCAFGQSSNETPVLSQMVINAEDHKIIFERITMPATKAEAVRQPAGEIDYSEPQLLRKSLSLSCTVFNHEFSEVRWRDASGGEYVIWSSIDFTLFTGRHAGCFVNGGVLYGLYLGLGEAAMDVAAAPLARFHALTAPAGMASWYAIVKQPKSPSSEAYAGINALHLYYDANKAAIIAEHDQVKASNAARISYDTAHPPEKQDTLIRFWPIQSVLHGVSRPATDNNKED